MLSMPAMLSHDGTTLWGWEEWAGNLFRVAQTAARINATGVRGLPSLQNTATQVGREVRKIMTKVGGTPPERLAVVEDITGVKKRLKSAHRQMKKMDGTRKRAPKQIAESSALF